MSISGDMIADMIGHGMKLEGDKVKWLTGKRS